MTQATRTKYRPVLTAFQIYKILALAKTEVPISDASLSIISTLSPFAAKIENAGITPAYTTSPPTLKYSLESLGGIPTAPIVTHKRKERLWEEAYIKYTSNPESCSVTEINWAKEHMYLNDLMSAEEMVEFEKAAFNGTFDDTFNESCNEE